MQIFNTAIFLLIDISSIKRHSSLVWSSSSSTNMESNFDTVPTSAITFVESEHGRLRRRQRGIDKKDLQRAMKYGKRTHYYRTREGHSTSKYSFNDIVYIVDDITHREITSYARPIELDLVPVTDVITDEHQRFVDNLKENLESWTSIYKNDFCIVHFNRNCALASLPLLIVIII